MRIGKAAVLLLSLFCLFASLTSCMDLGAGDDEYSFKDYFSSVILLDRGGGRETVDIEDITDFDGEDTESEIKEVIDSREYCYVAFEIKGGYTVKTSEFAMFARTDNGEGQISLEVYHATGLPTEQYDDDGNFICYDDEAVLFESRRCLDTAINVGGEWESWHFDLTPSVTAASGEYIIIKIPNNCPEKPKNEDQDVSEGGETATTPEIPDNIGVRDELSFTFNYTLFYFDEAEKN